MEKILLIGAGPMAIAYADVLKAMNKTFTAIGRGPASAENFKQQTGVTPILGGLSPFLAQNTLDQDTVAIIATGTEVLMSALILLLDAGVTHILIEKPAALSIEELITQEARLASIADHVFVGYNRRFYASVLMAEKLIEEDGGLLSMHFEFTEWSHKIGPATKAPGVKENWFFLNSSHVVDLAFFMSGKPVNWNAYSKTGTLSWHEKSNFAGAGITQKDVLFSYLSNWESAGRWAIELLTQNRRIYLKPLEGLSIQLKGSLALDEHPLDDTLDKQFKPGLYKQVEAFLSPEKNIRLVSLAEQIKTSKDIYRKILS